MNASKLRRVRLALEFLEDRTVPTIFIVNSLADDNVGSGNSGDLRYVINRANTLNTGTAANPDTIRFTGVTLTSANRTIRVGAGAAGAIPLPALADKAIIKGATAVGFNNLTGLLLQLNGSALGGGANGLTLNSGHSTVEALEIVQFPGNGIVVNSSSNTIGGTQVGVNAAGQRNNPAGRRTTPLPFVSVPRVIVRPPLGNIISANGGHGVFITPGSQRNVLAGNFIGTDVTGLKARGNGGDGVRLLRANNNQLLGTVPIDRDNPFVFYNVLSGNRGNGLRIISSNATKVFANIFGVGADDRTAVGNHQNGVLIEGTSDGTIFGGNIPLGNVTAANGRNGVEIKGSASRTLLQNTFAGLAAFAPGVPLGNRLNGFLITSTGGGKTIGRSGFSTLVLTNSIAGNFRNGIEIGGNAASVQISDSLIGVETNGMTAQPNRGNGVEIKGNASRISVGGFQGSVAGIQQFGSFFKGANQISGNLLNGVLIHGRARNITVINSLIGTNNTGTGPLGNGRNGVWIAGLSGVRVGAPVGVSAPAARNIIAFNRLNGVLVAAGTRNSVLGNSIFSNGQLGIALVASGNRNQPAPVMASGLVAGFGVGTKVSGTLTARPLTTYQIEIFGNPNGSRGNGRFFLGFRFVRTNAAGVAQFTLEGLVNPPAGAFFLSATATDLAGNTSMFSSTRQGLHNGRYH